MRRKFPSRRTLCNRLHCDSVGVLQWLSSNKMGTPLPLQRLGYELVMPSRRKIAVLPLMGTMKTERRVQRLAS